jgi:hypothetical protein
MRARWRAGSQTNKNKNSRGNLKGKNAGQHIIRGNDNMHSMNLDNAALLWQELPCDTASTEAQEFNQQSRDNCSTDAAETALWKRARGRAGS